MVWARICEEQHLDRGGSARTFLRVADAFDERLDERLHLLIQRVELVNGHVQQEFARAGGPLPFRGSVAAQRKAFLQAVQVERVEDARERGCRQARLGVIADVREAQAGMDEAPRTLAARNPRDLLDEAVLRQLAEVERAGGRALADELAGLGGS